MPTHDQTDDATVSSNEVEGTKVFSSQGDKLGTIQELMIDKISGRVRYAVMEFGGFLGLDTDRYPVPWTMLAYDTDKGGYRVPLDKAKLTGAPKFHHEQPPMYDLTYGSQVNDYYGVPMNSDP